MKLLKRIFVVLCVLCLGFTTGTSLTVLYAHHHHHRVAGVDYPYDATKYYSPTAIDYADSAPSRYALKDLAANGGNVYDYTRHIKSILFGEKFANWFQRLAEKWGILKKQTTPLTPEQKQKNMEDYQIILSAINNNRSDVNLDPEEFDMGIVEGQATRSTNAADQGKALSKAYETTVATNMNRNEAVDENIYPALQRAMEQSSQAEGKLQASQAGNQIQALRNLAVTNLTTNMGDLAKIRYMNSLIDSAEADKQYVQQRNGSYHFYDPYNSEEDQKMLENYYRVTGVQPYVSSGMPDFH
ncbi:hypothetical protein [Mitsuokella multacida]|uniref:hypothetical protein n=1 Tax=Mitsuokella multacida TaxID=52226 RepID=UPI0026DCDB29|nr:hypothetical protein [Mitsuokella multacida]